MTESDTTKLEAVPLRVVDKTRIPAKRYYDKGFYELECDRLWPHVWQMACRLEEIPEIGDYTTYTIFQQSVIIVRGKAGIKAFHNACRHRGVKLVTDNGNCQTKGFICPFHGWRWDMEGENTFVYGRKIFDEANLEAAELNLVPCRVELWAGCAFVNFDDAAPPLLETLGPVAKRLSDRNVEQLKMEWWYQTVLPTNWKLAMEAFMEGYHVMRTHPQLHLVGMPGAQIYGADLNAASAGPVPSTQEFVEKTIMFLQRLSDGMGGMVHRDEMEIAHELSAMELPEDLPNAAMTFTARLQEEITSRGRARGLDVPDLNELAQRNIFHAVEYMFPNYFLLPTFSAMSAYRIRPLTEETCLFELWSLAFLPENEHGDPVRPITLPYNSQEFPEIPRQDYSNLPLQQLGLHAKGFEFMRLSGEFEGLISNYQRLIDGYIAGLDEKKLVIATNRVNNGYDAPIVEFGF